MLHAAILSLALSLWGDDPQAKPLVTTTVGLEGRVAYRYKGPAVRARPAYETEPVALRIVSQAADGDATLYDLRFIAQYPGDFDLRNYLERLDALPLEAPSALVHVNALLPEDNQGALHEIAAGLLPKLGGYRVAAIALGVAWSVPLAWAIVRRVTRRKRVAVLVEVKSITLADQLRPLVVAAMAGELSTPERARLEMLLVGYWRDRLALQGLSHLDSLTRLREHAQAGEVVRLLELWLHRPRGEGEAVDVNELLRPYGQAAPAEAAA